MEEHVSTRDPTDFQEIQSDLQDIFSNPLDLYFHSRHRPDTLITPRIFRLIFKHHSNFLFLFHFLFICMPLRLVQLIMITSKPYRVLTKAGPTKLYISNFISRGAYYLIVIINLLLLKPIVY